MRMKKEDYISESTKALELELKDRIKQDKIAARAQRIVEAIPEELLQDVLNILSRNLGTK